MSPTIIVGYDGSPRSQDALALGGLLASLTGAKLILACVHDANQSISAAILPNAVDQRLKDQARETLAKAPVETFDRVLVRRRVLADSSPPAALYRLAVRERADLIVLGSTTRTRLARVHPGSAAERLLDSAPCAVAVSPAGYQASPQQLARIAVAYDGREESEHALQSAAALARRAGAQVQILRVRDPVTAPVGPDGAQAYAELEREMQRACEEQVAGAKARVSDSLNVSTEVLRGDAADALADATGEGVDLLIAGSRSYGPMRNLLVGGVSNQLTRKAACAVLIVPRGVQLTFEPPSGTGGKIRAGDLEKAAQRA